MLIDVGQVVAKKYELVRLLGRGSMGEVWSAHHQALREQVALKVLAWPPSGEDAEDPAVALARFRFEAQVAAHLSRKTRHIARVTDYGEDDGLPYLVMELLDGETLDAALRERGVMPPIEVAATVSQIARALGQAHLEGVAHRDLKPANVFLTRDEDGRLLVKLLDFGIARTIHAHRLPGTFSTAKGFVFGTPGYMSPEQTRASPKLDHRCDLWALATIAYQMMTGHLPVDGADTEEIMKNICAGRVVPLGQRNPALSAALGAFFDRAFADRVDDRFADAASLAHAFEVAAGAETVIVPPPSSPSLTSLTDTGSTTGTEFSTSVEGEALRLHRLEYLTRVRLKIATLGVAAAAVVVTAVVAMSAAWRSPGSASQGPPATAEATAADATVRAVVKPGASLSVEAAPSTGPSPPANDWAPAPATVPPAVAPVAPAAAIAPGTPALRAASTPRSIDRPAPAATSRVKPAADPAPARPARPSQRPADDRNDVF
jgi:serine/threonine-protein kinase